MTEADSNLNKSNESSANQTPESDFRSAPGLWSLLGEATEVAVSSDFPERVVEAATRPRGRHLLFRRPISLAIAAGLLVLAVWWLSHDGDRESPSQQQPSSPELTASEIEALLEEYCHFENLSLNDLNFP